MKSKRLIAALLVIAMAVLAGCSGGTPTQTQAPQQAAPQQEATQAPQQEAPQEPVQTTVLRMAFPDPVEGAMSDAVQKFADELYARSGGRYSIEIGWAGAMGFVGDYFDMVRDGLVDFGFFLPTVTPGVFPLCSIMDLPWVIESAEVSSKALQYLWDEGYLKDSKLSEVKVLFLDAGLGANIYSVKEGCATLSDFKGQKVVAIGDMMLKASEALGMSPAFYAHAEHYSVFQKKVMDANFCPWDGIGTYKLEEVMSSCLETRITNTTTGLLMSKKTYESMPADVQQIVDDLIDEVLKPLSIERRDALDTEFRQRFLDSGGTVSQLTDADRAAMSEALAPLWDQWLAEVGDGGEEALKAMYKFMKDFGVENPAIGYNG